jgi:hypothetical protein
MDTITKQDRITLKNLKVADFASEETLCFTATVVFDGTPIAEARNDGHGGSTFLRALKARRRCWRRPKPSPRACRRRRSTRPRDEDPPHRHDARLPGR